MKIGFDAKRSFLNRSGLGNYSRFIIDSLLNLYPKNDYYLFTPKASKSFTHNKIPDKFIITPDSFIEKKIPSYWRSYQITKRIKDLKLNIYHGLSGEIPHNIKSGDTKSVVTIHDLIFLRFPALYKSVDRKIYEKKFRYACENSDKIIAISLQTKSDIIEFFNIPEDKISVLYQGCNEIFHHSVPSNEKNRIIQKYKLPDNYLLYVGTIEERKNLLSVIKAIQISETNMPLVVVGNPKQDYFKKVTDYIDKNRIKDILFLEKTPTADLPAIYQMADIFIYPSVFEGFGIPVLEALYSGTPVITSKDGCFREAGGPGSFYINPSNSAEISDAIKKILTDSDFRSSMIKSGLEYSANFEHKKLSEQLMKLYNSL